MHIQVYVAAVVSQAHRPTGGRHGLLQQRQRRYILCMLHGQLRQRGVHRTKQDLARRCARGVILRQQRGDVVLHGVWRQHKRCFAYIIQPQHRTVHAIGAAAAQIRGRVRHGPAKDLHSVFLDRYDGRALDRHVAHRVGRRQHKIRRVDLADCAVQRAGRDLVPGHADCKKQRTICIASVHQIHPLRPVSVSSPAAPPIAYA
jgi:hypothetical protein